MNTLVISDIHGSTESCKKALSYIKTFDCKRIFLLGDILYNGFCNPIKRHNSSGIIELLNNIKDKIVAVRGNCDSEIDLDILDFNCETNLQLNENGLRIFLSHGHMYDPYFIDKRTADVYFYGHTHIFAAMRNPNGVFCLNPGSISLPRNQNPPTFGIYSANSNVYKFSIYNLNTGEKLAHTEIFA